MPIFEIEGPDGTYEVDAPDETQAISAFKKMQGVAMPTEAEDKSYTGAILPFSVDAQGNKSFDSDAGLLGSLKRSFMLPGDVYAGKVDPMSEEGIGRALEFATTFASPSPAIRAGDRAIPGTSLAMRRGKVEPPSAEALKEAARVGYDQVRDAGVDYSAKSVQTLARAAQSELEKDGILKELAPKSFSILDKLSNAPEGAVAPISGIEAARRAFGNAAKDFANPTEQLAAKRVMERLDQFVMDPDASSVVAGAAGEAGSVLKAARGNYAAAKRSGSLTGVQEAAELRAAAANSGQNVGNSVRSRIASLLLKPKEAAGFTEAEIGQLNKVARGSRTANTTRVIGNLLGGGGGLGAGFTAAAGAGAGAMTGSPAATVAGAALPLAGAASKQISNILTERALAVADKMTRSRSPLYAKMQDEAPMEVISPEMRAALVKALLLQKQQAN
jgi:hypothetical protein